MSSWKTRTTLILKQVCYPMPCISYTILYSFYKLSVFIRKDAYLPTLGDYRKLISVMLWTATPAKDLSDPRFMP